MGFGPASRYKACLDFGLPPSSPVYIQHPLPLGPRLGPFLIAVASVPHPLPLTVTCCFFFSSTDAILLSKLCLSSVLSGWIKVSHVTLRIRTKYPPPAPVSQLNCCYKNKLFIPYAKHFTSFFVGLLSFSTRVLVVLLPSTSSSPMIGV
jgi:hypothetical protein